MIEIIKKKIKTSNEKKFINKALMNIGLFEKHKTIFDNEQVLNYFYRELKYKYYEKNQIIFHEGETGDLFYILIKGK